MLWLRAIWALVVLRRQVWACMVHIGTCLICREAADRGAAIDGRQFCTEGQLRNRALKTGWDALRPGAGR